MRVTLRFSAGLVVLLVLGWLALWWYAQGRMQAGFAHWADGVAASGAQVSYDSVKRGTSPFTAEITLTNLNITTAAMAHGSAVVTLPSLAFRIGLFDPLLLHIDLPNRITSNFNGFSAVIATQSVVVTDQLDPHALTGRGENPFRGGMLDASGIDILASSGSLLVLHVDSLRGNYTYDQTAGAAAAALQSFFVVNGVALSPLLTHLLSIPFDGRIAQFGQTLRLSGPVPAALPDIMRQINALPPGDLADRQKLIVPVARQWAAAGGNAHLMFSASVGPSTATAAATLGFDANVQPRGTADVTAAHLDAFTAALLSAYPQAQGDVEAIEARLSPYITSDPASGQTLAVHAVFGSGAVSVNGKPAGSLPPVDWNALENPPPADSN